MAKTILRVKSGSAEGLKTPLLVIPCFEGGLGRAGKRIDRQLGGLLSRLLDRQDFEGKRDTLHIQDAGPDAACARIGLLGLGNSDEFSLECLRRAGAVLAGKLPSENPAAIVVFDDLPRRPDARDAAQAFTEGIELARYAFDAFRDRKSAAKSAQVTLLDSRDKTKSALTRGVKAGSAIARGVALARDLGNLPGNHGRPAIIARKAATMARKVGLKSKILNRKQIEEEKMGALLSVSLGSPHEPRLIVLTHKTTKKGAKTICLVGKGLTFDSGGISIKPSADMDKMRYDKCGGCVVIGAMQAIAELDLPINVIGIVPSSENMPGGDANKPGDVVRAMNGKTIEILNTDAEGRLILADALCYAGRFKPDHIVDLATLTGACMIALGSHCAGLMTEDEELADRLVKAGNSSFDRVWRLPLWDEYRDEMKGTTTDLKNLGGRYGGAITAGAFLKEFTDGRSYAHLDIAGVSWDDAKRPYNRGKGATGFGVRLLVRFLQDLAN